MPAVEVLDVKGAKSFLHDMSPEFISKTVAIAARNGLNPSYLAAVMAFESSFDPHIINSEGCVGLIQWCSSGRHAIGKTTQELLAMTAERQLDEVEKSYQIVMGAVGRDRLDTIEDHYVAIFSPGMIGRPLDEPFYLEGSRQYAANKGLDQNKDGAITPREAAHRVRYIVEEAQGRPPLLVDSNAPLPAPGGPKPGPSFSQGSLVATVALSSVLGWAAWRLYKKQPILGGALAGAGAGVSLYKLTHLLG